MAGEERRQHPRFPLRAQAEVHFINWTVFKLLYTVNISKGGMNLELPDEPKKGDRLRVKLILPHGWPHRADHPQARDLRTVAPTLRPTARLDRR